MKVITGKLLKLPKVCNNRKKYLGTKLSQFGHKSACFSVCFNNLFKDKKKTLDNMLKG